MGPNFLALKSRFIKSVKVFKSTIIEFTTFLRYNQATVVYKLSQLIDI